jgi:hypothetical protein
MKLYAPFAGIMSRPTVAEEARAMRIKHGSPHTAIRAKNFWTACAGKPCSK